ncbi:MAG: glycosyltransferase [Agriterribacter sp.]
MNIPEISIVMPAYNAERYIVAAIQSILDQSFENFELLVIDDASTDETLSIAREFADKRIIVTPNKGNKGNYATRNLGIKMSRGKYICVMDADDISLPNRLATQVKWMKKNDHAGIAGSFGDIIDSNGNFVEEYLAPSGYNSIRLRLLTNMCFIHSSVMMNRSFLKKYYIRYNEAYYYAGDYELLVRCAQKFPINIIPEKLVYYRKHASQISTAKYMQQAHYADLVRLKQLALFKPSFTDIQTAIYLKLTKNLLLLPDEFDIAINCLNMLLKQNEKLKLFKQEKLHYFFTALLSRSKLEQKEQDTKLGGFAIEQETVNILLKKIPQSSLILELGSGSGTDILLKYYKVVSIEHNLFYAIQRSPEHTCIHAPLQSYWYQPEYIANALSLNPALILIDGPRGELRKNILGNLDLFRHIVCPVIFDDVDRDTDYLTAIEFCRKLKYNMTVLKGENKKNAWCEKINQY